MYPLSKCTKSGSSRKPVTCGVRESSPVIFHENYFASSDPTNGRWGGWSWDIPATWGFGRQVWGGGGGRGKRRKEEEGDRRKARREEEKIKQPHLERCEQKIRKPEMSLSRLTKIKLINNGHDRSPVGSCLGKLVAMRGERVQVRLPHVTHCLHFAVSAFSPSGSDDRWLACFSRLRHVGKHDQPHLSE